jgi:hypothetical protein
MYVGKPPPLGYRSERKVENFKRVLLYFSNLLQLSYSHLNMAISKNKSSRSGNFGAIFHKQNLSMSLHWSLF